MIELNRGKWNECLRSYFQLIFNAKWNIYAAAGCLLLRGSHPRPVHDKDAYICAHTGLSTYTGTVWMPLTRPLLVHGLYIGGTKTKPDYTL